VERVKRGFFDAVLMDVQMPVMDGFQATRAIRGNLGLESLPIIAMTAGATTRDQEAALAAGMNDHVAKPIDVKTLFAALTKAIGPFRAPEPEIERGLDPPEGEVEELERAKIPGVDLRAGLKRVNGNGKLYLTLLKRFHEDYGDAAHAMRRALAAGDREVGLGLAHAIKGVAGNIEMSAVHAAAKDLEAALKIDALSDDLRVLDNFERALDEVAGSLKRFFDSRPEGNGAAFSAGVEEEGAALTDLLGRLRSLLGKRDPKRSKALMDEIERLSFPEFLAGDIQDLGRMVRKYKFKEAAPILEKVIQALR
jgi:CheY-like chemotaxis protein